MIETPAPTDQPRPGTTPKEDHSTLAPLCGEAEFAELVAEMVADEAPRLFAVAEEHGKRVDGRIARGAWSWKTAPRSSVLMAV